MFQTPEDIKQKKIAKKEKKAAKAAAKANGTGKSHKGHNHSHEHDHSHDHHGHDHSHHAVEAPRIEEVHEDVDAAPEATGVESAQDGGITQRPPRATVEEDEDE